MLTVLLAIFLIIGAVVFFLWLVRSMMSVSCPQCMEDHGTEEIIIPIIPGWRWFCPTCNGIFTQKKISEQNKTSSKEDEETE